MATRPDSGRTRRKAGDATRRRLLRAAERLFAQYGIDAVSLNEIVHASKANAAAIHYHFGTREALITAIIEQRREAWAERRNEMVAELAARKAITARDVVRAMVEPIAALADHPWGMDYIRFVANVANHPKYAPLLHEAGGYEMRDVFFELVERVTPDLTKKIRLARFSFVGEFAYHALGASDQRVAMWVTTVGGSLEGWTHDDLIDMLTGALTAPVHRRT